MRIVLFLFCLLAAAQCVDVDANSAPAGFFLTDDTVTCTTVPCANDKWTLSCEVDGKSFGVFPSCPESLEFNVTRDSKKRSIIR